MKKIRIFVSLLTLCSILFSSCNVNPSDKDAGNATRQGLYMYNYWSNGMKQVAINYLNIAFELNGVLAASSSDTTQFSVSGYVARNVGDGLYQLYRDEYLVYEIATGGKLLSDAAAHWTVEMKESLFMDYECCVGAYFALADFPDGTLAHLQNIGNMKWKFQIGRDPGGMVGDIAYTYLDLTLSSPSDEIPETYYGQPFEVAGNGQFSFTDYDNLYDLNVVGFQIGETLVKGRYDNCTSGTLQATAWQVKDSGGQLRDYREKTADFKFLMANGNNVVMISINNHTAIWNLSGYLEDEIE